MEEKSGKATVSCLANEEENNTYPAQNGKKTKRNNKSLKQRRNVKRDAGELTSADGLWRYTISGGNARIAGYTGNATILRIPDEVDGYAVTEIGSNAFSGSAVQGITFPKTLKVIETSAFAGCEKLSGVSFTKNEANGYALRIGIYAFQNCASLSNVSFSDNVTAIGSYAFDGCKGIDDIALPSRLETLGYYAFKGTYLTTVTIPKTVTRCDSNNINGPFSGASQLKEVVFEEGMAKIPDCVLASSGYTSYVTKVVIPSSVTEIGYEAFYKCDNMAIYGYTNSYAETYANENGIPFISVAISKDATPDDVISKMNLKNLINNVSLGGDTINGPSITIGKHTFSLFSVDGKMNMSLGDKLQAKVDPRTKTVQVLIGFDKFSGSANLDSQTNSTNYWSESYQQVKALYTGVTGKKVDNTKLWNKFSALRGKLRKHKMSMGIDASASAAGYIEFSYASGEIVFSQGGIVLEAALGFNVSYPIPPAPALYVTFGLEAGFNGELKLVRRSALNYSPSMNAEIEMEATIGAGVGSNKAKTYAELGMKGTLFLGVVLPASSLSDSLTADLDVSIYFNSQVFGFDGPSYGPEQLWGTRLYPRRKSARLFGGRDLAEYDWSKAKLSDRNYLRAAANSRTISDNEIYSKENLYRYNTPRLVQLNDGTLLLVWIDDNGTKSGINKTSLMYSVFDGSAWSEARAIAETGGANDYPAVYSDGEKVQIIWQKAPVQADNAELMDVLCDVDLYSVTYENGTMGEATQITSNNTAYEMMQCVTADEKTVSVVWVENSVNNPFQAEGTQTIKKADCIDGNWVVDTVAENLEEVNNLHAAYVGGELAIVYEASSEENGKITLIQTDVKKSFDGNSAEIVNGILYYASKDGLISYDIINKLSETVIEGINGDFTVLDDGTNKAVVTTVYNGFTSEMVYYTFDRMIGKWSDAVSLTDEGKYIRDYSAVMDKGGKLSIVTNLVDVDENAQKIYGDATMKVFHFKDIVDVSVGDGAFYDEELLKPDGELPLTFDVTNKGIKAIDTLDVAILDEGAMNFRRRQFPVQLGLVKHQA